MVLRLSVALSFVALLVLAALQYHWIGQIAVAERQRLERSVALSSRELADDFVSEFRNLGNVLEPRFSPVSFDSWVVAARYQDWLASAAYPDLVRNLYLVRPSDEVLRFNPTAGIFERDSSASLLPFIAGWLAGQVPSLPPMDSDLLVLSFNRRFPGLRGPDAFRDAFGGADRQTNDGGWIVMELNRDVMVNHFLPRLVALRFTEYEGQEYRVAVTATQPGSRSHTVFASGVAWTERDLESPDFSMELLGAAPLQRRGNGPGGPLPTRGGRGGERGRGPDPRGPAVTLAGQTWTLLVKHRAGSVETAVTDFRTRNLAISFGVLVVLGISAVAIVISSARARRLGRLQMEFAAGISHELRTPLAVIQSAAHNLGSGVVQDREGIQEYAAIVGSEARRLTEMVEQVMAYTETQSGGKGYVLAPVDANDVVDNAIRSMANVLREGNSTVHNKVESELPLVMADVAALTRCIQNLLSNAIKYGRRDQGADIEIRCRHISDLGSAGKVELSIVDHGAGVPETDVRYLFEPFHRGSNANTNTPGNGLGLHLVERIMKAQNGAVTYQREPDGGARFTLILQAVASPA